MSLRISLDNGETWQSTDNIRVIHNADEETELHVNHTYEGIIMDVYDTERKCIGTSSEMADEIIERLSYNFPQ